jgi:hypothetical protein
MGIWNLIAGPILGIINKLIPDKAAAAVAQVELQKMAASGAIQEELAQLQAITSAQSDINKVEAASTNWWVAGARPGIMWVCFAALASQYVLRPFVIWGFVLAGHSAPALPGLDDNLWQLMFGMLGMGTLRTAEKFKGVAGNH